MADRGRLCRLALQDGTVQVMLLEILYPVALIAVLLTLFGHRYY